MSTRTQTVEQVGTAPLARPRTRVNPWRFLLYAIAIVFAAYYLLPIFLLVLTGLKSYNEISLYEMWNLPRTLSFQSFQDAWFGSPSVAGLGRNFVNSLIMAIPATIISALLGMMNGYVLSKWRFRGANIIFPLILFGMFIPYQSILIPLVTTLNAIKLYGSLAGLTFVHIVYGIPICALIFRNYYANIPNEMIEASRIDGANFFSIFTRIMVPLSAPGIVVVAIWQFTNVWNDFLFAITVTNNPANQPITVALNNLAGSFTVEWNVQFAAALIAAAPTILLYVLLGPFFVRGLMAGSLKGQMNSLGIGLIGFGMIGKVHALAYREIPHYYPGTLPPIELAAVGTTRADSAQRAAREGGFHAWTTNLDELVTREDVQIVDVCLPNYAHRPAILAALRAGKHVIVDKPLALNSNEAIEIAAVARAANLRVGIVFNYRFVPALLHAKHLLEQGALGQIYHFHLDYLHTGYQNPNRPMSWRLRQSQSGGGALVDLGSHVIDLARYLLGDFETVSATTCTYIQSRQKDPKSDIRESVDVDDAAWVQARMKNGASGTLFVTRFATGAVDDMNVQIYGERGALKFSLQDANVLQWFDAKANGETQGWTRIPTGTQYGSAVVPPPRSILGWNRTHAENLYQFLRAIVENEPFAPDVTDGVRVHQVIDAAYEAAASSGWVAV